MSFNARFDEFINALRPGDGQLAEAKTELDLLEKKLKTFISDDDDFDFGKVLRSGSYAKNTLLKRHESGDFDADAAVYVKPPDEDEEPGLATVLDYVEKLLRRAYANRTKRKPVFDRTPKSAVKVKFEVTPKINIDAVPVVAVDHATIPNWGKIPRRSGGFRSTSVTEHITFVTERNKVPGVVPFNHLLMVMKWWRNHNFDESEHAKFSSFALELVVGKAFDAVRTRLSGLWLDDLLAIGTWILRHRFASPIDFPDPRVPAATGVVDGQFLIIDPMNSDNNVAHDWMQRDVDEFLEGLDRFCDVVQDAANEAAAGEEHEAALLLDQVLPNFSNWSVE